MTVLPPLYKYIEDFSVTLIDGKSVMLIGGHNGQFSDSKNECFAFNVVKGIWDTSSLPSLNIQR